MRGSSILLRVLASPHLSLGENRIEPLEPSIPFPGDVSLFIGRVALLNASYQELYVIDGSEGTSTGSEPTPGMIDACAQQASAQAITEVWLVSDRFTEDRTIQVRTVRISVARASDVLETLLSVPATAGTDFCRAVGTTLSFLQSTYQRRKASSFAFQARERTLRRTDRQLDLDGHLALWADSDRSPKPIFLLGDRGAGKTWQLLRFCIEQNGRHAKRPLESPPAVYVNLRDWSRQWAAHQAVGLFSLITNQCPSLVVKWNSSMLRALVSEGRVVVCFDGFDEIQRQPSARQVQEHLVELFRLLPPGARFVVACRTTLFDSFTSLARLSTWSASSLGASAEVVEMQPFTLADIKSYLQTVSALAVPDAFSTEALLRGDDVIAEALRQCLQQPGLLAHLRANTAVVDHPTGLIAIREVMEGALISFNLDTERTKVMHRDAHGLPHRFDNRQRAELLGELAWFMAERSLRTMNLNSLPVRLGLLYGIDSDALKRDIRSQTVFELTEGGPEQEPEVSFGVHYQLQFAAPSVPERPLQGSVAQDYFVARHLYRRMSECVEDSSLDPEEPLRFLGSVALTTLSATLLRQMCDEGPQLLQASHLTKRARRWLGQAARRGKYEVFAAPYRYLVRNLARMACISNDLVEKIDPWYAGEELTGFWRHPSGLPSYEMVLVPECESAAIRKWGSSRDGCGSQTGDAGGPFLIGLHEVTNEEYLRFIEDTSGAGREWGIERVTRAGSLGEPLSKFASRTNEYHLYFWDKDDGGRFRPDSAHIRYPVVYVSWFAALSFCDWLTKLEGRQGSLELSPERGHSVEQSGTVDAPPFRLPTAIEWRWAAQGSYKEAAHPWDLVPYPSTNSRSTTIAAYRRAVRNVLMDRHHRSSAVAYDDEFSVFGVAGLVGNVKEWVHDTIPSTKTSGPLDVALVLGSTAHLDESSFRFDYFATLFPENTNPDVGFRMARSLSGSELGALKRRQTEVASRASGVD